MNIQNVKEGAQLLRDGISKLARGPLDYYLFELVGCYEFLLTLAPHKKGDRVQLTKTPDINPHDSWGWMPYRHFLIAGAVATVDQVRADGSGFIYSLVFDDETWIDREGVKYPTLEKSVFVFRADSVGCLPPTTPEGTTP